MKPRFILLALLAFTGRSLAAADAPKAPTIDDLLKLKTIGGNQISPDGHAVAYGVAEADFEHDAFVTNIWIAREGTAPFQLTRGQKSASAFRWSADSRWLAFLSSRVGDKAQIFVIRPDGGEAIQLTNIESDVTSLEWSPAGTRRAFTAGEPETK
jgi:Tol biopolymer transport system component